MLVFPVRLFAPQSMTPPRLIGAAASGGVSMGGVTQLGVLHGGGFWEIAFGEVSLWTRETMLAWRALEAALDNGATPVIVPLGDRKHQPVTSPPSSLAFDDDSIWDDGTSWMAAEVSCDLDGDHDLRATTLAIEYEGDVPLVGGEYFSILHAEVGWRLYQVIRVSEDGESLTIRPPLRRAVTDGTPLNFEAPRCVCRLDGDLATVLEMLRFGRGGPARFVETFATVGA